jgi:argininosuccinate lyase
MSAGKQSRTVVGDINSLVLEYTAGQDYKLDRRLVEADCVGSAAHASMLAELPGGARLFSISERDQLIAELRAIMELGRRGEFEITVDDQDVHLAIERALTAKLGDLGKKIHTARSRNDQVALDLRLYAREQLLATVLDAAELARALSKFARRYAALPMVGRTHMQPAMPSSVGLWASAFAEGLLGDIELLWEAYRQNDSSPLGSAASYGVPLPIKRELVASLLGFKSAERNVLRAANQRGKLESIILAAMSQTMLTVSRLAQDMILFSMPEFGYFKLPREYCTGSSIMPQKNNPDVLELVRARTAKVKSFADCVFAIVQSSPSGYNRDLQEAKEPFMAGIEITRQTLQIMAQMVSGMRTDRERLLAGFTPDVFATDRAIELVAGGMPFRDAYHHVKDNLDELAGEDPCEAIRKKTHLGATNGLDFDGLDADIRQISKQARAEQRRIQRRIGKLMSST